MDYTGKAIYETFVLVDHRSIIDYITQGELMGLACPELMQRCSEWDQAWRPQ